MIGNINTRRGAWRTLSAAGLVAGALLAVAPGAFAGECPADKRGVDVRKPVTHKPKDVTDKVLAAIDLSKEKVALKDHGVEDVEQHELGRECGHEPREVLAGPNDPDSSDAGRPTGWPDQGSTDLILLAERAGGAFADIAGSSRGKQRITKDLPVVRREAKRSEEGSLEAANWMGRREQVIAHLLRIDAELPQVVRGTEARDAPSDHDRRARGGHRGTAAVSWISTRRPGSGSS